MIESGRRASLARTCNVSSAVSETPVKTVPSAFEVGVALTGPNLPHFRTFSMVRRLRVVVDDLYRFLPIVLPMVVSSVPLFGHLPVDDALAALDLLVRPGVFAEFGEFVEHVRRR